jgi:hypothetical protein
LRGVDDPKLWKELEGLSRGKSLGVQILSLRLVEIHSEIILAKFNGKNCIRHVKLRHRRCGKTSHMNLSV